jgi:hypothetical protein
VRLLEVAHPETRGGNGVRTDATYRGTRDADSAVAMRYETGKEPVALGWRLDLRKHSPSGLNWGYAGSGPAQCALAILADYFEDNDQLALALYQDFKFRFVAGFGDTWTLEGREILDWVSGSGEYRHEDKLRMRRVVSCTQLSDGGGYEITMDCGHRVWAAAEPNLGLNYCGECLDEVVRAVRAERRTQGA